MSVFAKMVPVVCRCIHVQVYVIDPKEGSAGDVEVKAVCAFDCASVVLKNIELTVHIVPSGQGDHLGMKDKETFF